MSPSSRSARSSSTVGATSTRSRPCCTKRSPATRRSGGPTRCRSSPSTAPRSRPAPPPARRCPAEARRGDPAGPRQDARAALRLGGGVRGCARPLDRRARRRARVRVRRGAAVHQPEPRRRERVPERWDQRGADSGPLGGAGLRVVGRTSAFACKGLREDVRVLGERLRVDVVVDGSVRVGGDRVRVAAQLVSTADGYQLWSARYDRVAGDTLSSRTSWRPRSAPCSAPGWRPGASPPAPACRRRPSPSSRRRPPGAIRARTTRTSGAVTTGTSARPRRFAGASNTSSRPRRSPRTTHRSTPRWRTRT